jgi:hypothetical protein
MPANLSPDQKKALAAAWRATPHASIKEIAARCGVSFGSAYREIPFGVKVQRKRYNTV